VKNEPEVAGVRVYWCRGVGDLWSLVYWCRGVMVYGCKGEAEIPDFTDYPEKGWSLEKYSNIRSWCGVGAELPPTQSIVGVWLGGNYDKITELGSELHHIQGIVEGWLRGKL